MKPGLKLLMMEDSSVDAELIQRIVRKEYPDCHFEQVSVREHFLETLQKELPDVILADNSLPGFDAREALRMVRQQGLLIPFIMVSGTMQEDYAVQVIKDGADDYILKDRLARLPAAIEAAIRYRESEKEKAGTMQQLKDSEEKYRTIVERISDGFFIVDRDWGVIYANHTAEILFGRETGSLQGKKMNEEFPQAVGRPFFNAYLEALKSNEAVQVEEYSIIADRWMQASMYPSENGVAVFVRDKTAQRKAEEANRISEEKYQTMLERISDGFMVLDRNWTVKYINLPAERLLQRPAGYLLGKKMQDEFPGALDRPFFKAYDEALRTGVNKYIEEYSISINRWFQASIYPSPDGVAIFFRDITEQRKAEEDVRKSEEKFRNFIQRITDGFISLDTNWCYTYLNTKAAELVHRKPEELIGKSVWAEFPDAMYSETYKAFHQAMKEQRYITNVDYYPPLDLWQENHIYPTEDGISVFIRNITEKKKLEQALQERQRKEQQQMIEAAIEAQEKERNAIAIELHDNVNQILVGTKITMSMLRDNPKDPAAVLKSSLENLDLAINENRRIAHELVTPDLTEQHLVQQLENLCNNMLHPNGIETFIQHEDYEKEKISDKLKLAIYRIAQEQCTNIVKYAKATSVVFSLSVINHELNFRIADNGIGAQPGQLVNGIGLQNINNRVRILNGVVQINTAPDNGFELEVIVPL